MLKIKLITVMDKDMNNYCSHSVASSFSFLRYSVHPHGTSQAVHRQPRHVIPRG
jgi:hypothetical protein